MEPIYFDKMEGAGNDFIVIDNRSNLFTLDEIIAFTPKLCDRRFGVGADGILVLENPKIPNVDYTMVYRNADGSDAGMCGNGSRCLALYAVTKGFDKTHTFNVHDAIYTAEVDVNQQQVQVSFPDIKVPSTLEISSQSLSKVYTGTEHVVKFVSPEMLENEKHLVEEGSSIRWHDFLNPPGTNVNFVHIIDSNSIKLQTYERGVENLTLACGTGAIASAIATHHKNELLDGNFIINVDVKGGQLQVLFEFDNSENIYKHTKLKGPAHFVFNGTFNV